MPEHILTLLITGCFMLQPISTDLYLASMPHLVTEFGVSAAVVQQTLSLFAIGFSIAQLFSGPLSDRFGRRPVMLGGLIVYLGASLACALSPGIYFLIAARFAQAIGCCTALVATRAVIRDCYPPAEGAQRIARASNYMGFAVITGPIIGAQLQAHFGWRAAFFLHAAFSLLVLASAWHWLRETNRQPNPRATAPLALLRTYGEIATTPAFWAYALAGGLSYGTIFVFIAGASFGFIRVLGVSTADYGYCYALGCAGYMTGSYLCRRLLPRLGLSRTIGLGAKIMATGGIAFLATTLGGIQHWSLLILFQFICMFSHGLAFPAAQAGSAGPFPQKAGAAAGLFGAISMLGALVVANWVGISLDGTLMPLARICGVMGVLLFVAVRLTEKHGKIA